MKTKFRSLFRAIPILVGVNIYGQNIQVRNIIPNILKFDNSSTKLIDSLNMKNDFHISRYFACDDFNNDGKKDFFLNYAGNPEIAWISSVFLNSNNSFVEDINFRQVQIGQFWCSPDMTADFDNDGSIDVFQHTLNYHGRPGFQPKGYFPGINDYPDNWLLNKNGKFKYVKGDSLIVNKDYLKGNYPFKFDVDQDGKEDILFGYIGQGQFGGLIDDYKGYKSLFYSYKLTSSGSYERKFHFDIPYVESQPWIINRTYPFSGSCIPINKSTINFLTANDRVYNIKTKELSFDTGLSLLSDWRSVNEIFINSLSVLNNGNNFTHKNICKIKIEYPYVVESDFGTFFKDVNNDGILELITFEHQPNPQGGRPLAPCKIAIYSMAGEEESSKYFLNNENYDNTFSDANGIFLIDLENDGDIDIVPVNGWFENYSGDYNYNIFINQKGKFIKTRVIFPSKNNANNFYSSLGNWNGFKVPIDIDNDGLFEIIHIKIKENLDVVSLFLNDDDFDGVKNQFDKCPNTPIGSKVDESGCEIVLSIKNENDLVYLSPNPVVNEFKINFPVEFGKTAQVKIVDMAGNVHFKKASVMDGELIDLNNLSGGNYILQLHSNENASVKSIKISKIQ